jgi:hypothetical protein
LQHIYPNNNCHFHNDWGTMEYGNKIKRLVGDCAKAVLVAAVFVYPVHAEQPLNDVSKEIGALRDQIDRAVLVVVSRDWTFPRRGGEAELAERGCRYELTGRTAVAPLMDILSRSQFSDDDGKGGYSLRMGIYLYAQNGSKTTLLFGDSAGDMRGTYKGQGIVAKAPFDADIRELVAKIAPTEVHYKCEGDASMRLPQT